MSELSTELEIANLPAEVARLRKIIRALMARAEREMDGQESDFGQFRTSVMLEDLVRERTRELELALAENRKITRELKRANAELEAGHEAQHNLIRKLEETHHQLVESEKMASVGQLAAGVAHEINNPIGFIRSNLGTLRNYVADLTELIALYDEQEPAGAGRDDEVAAIQAFKQRIDLDFMRQDIVTLIAESRDGADRVKRIVNDLLDFARPCKQEWRSADIHAGLDSALNMISNEARNKAEIVCEYAQLPLVECLPSQLNQVFMNLLMNAVQAIQEHGTITIHTALAGDFVSVSIADTGHGIAPEVVKRIFDPFFTTRPVGAGTGLGLSVSYGIVKKHHGRIEVESLAGRGSTFTVWLPVKQAARL